MKTACQVVVSLAGLLILTTFLFGCASNPHDLVQQGTVEVERVDSRHARVWHVSVTRKASGLVLSGVLHRRTRLRMPMPGHVDIEVVAADGSMLAQASTGYRSRSRKARTARFSVEIPTETAEVAEVRVIHHVEPHRKLC